jgi:hypothetical protein
MMGSHLKTAWGPLKSHANTRLILTIKMSHFKLWVIILVIHMIPDVVIP